MGDANADWLAYGLEDALSEKPEIGIVRKHRTDSGLIRYDGRRDTEWAQVAREIIAADKPKFVVMMVGNNDRQQIREEAAPGRSRPGAPKAAAQPAQPEPVAQRLPRRLTSTRSSRPRSRRGSRAARQSDAGAGAAGRATVRGIPYGKMGGGLYQARRRDHRRAQERRRAGAMGRAAVAARRQSERRFRLSQRDLPQPGGEGGDRLCRYLGRLRRRGRPLLAAGAGLRRTDQAAAHQRRCLFHQVRRAQACPLRRA